MLAQNMLADNSRVIFLNIIFILKMQKLYKLFLGEFVFFIYNNNFMFCWVILSDFDNLKLDLILQHFYLVTMGVL